jgi:hypothetical protein
MKFEFDNEEPIEAKDADEASELYFNRYQNEERYLEDGETYEVKAVCEGITYVLRTEVNGCCDQGCCDVREYFGEDV